MFVARLTFGCVVSALLLAGCSQTPTSPSTISAPGIIGQVPQASVPVPPRLSVDPPRALGATRYLAFGDSITWGAFSAWDARFLFAAANGGYPERLQAGLNQHHSPQQFTVINEGQPGEQAINALSRFRLVLTNHRPEVVLLLEGVNDLNNDIEVSRISTSLQQMLDAAASAGIPVVIGTMYQTYAVTDPTGFYRHNGAASIPAFNTEIRRIAGLRLNVHVADLEPVMRDREMVGADGIHLTDAGFTVMAAVFLEAIEKAFPVRGSFQ
jgi:lysophospholipase L1-like esterase